MPICELYNILVTVIL